VYLKRLFRGASLRTASPRSFQRTIDELISRTVPLLRLNTVKRGGIIPTPTTSWLDLECRVFERVVS